MNETCVIVADKHPHMLEGIRGILSSEFDNVVMVSDRRTLKSLVRRLSPDLVVVELSLPESDGLNIARVLRDESPDLKIITLSLYGDSDVAKTVLDAGAMGFVLKRMAGEELLLAVKAAKRGKCFISQSIQMKPA